MAHTSIEMAPWRPARRRQLPAPGAAVLLVASVLVTACSELPNEYIHLRPLDPVPAAYRTWFGEVMHCAGRPELDTDRRFDRIEWRRAGLIVSDDGTRAIDGTWVAPHLIILDSDLLADEGLVKHEIVHDLLQRSGHDSPLFQECAAAASDGEVF